jgi:hypothetical protein
MSTIRNGSVRITSSDVHKWETGERKRIEYDYSNRDKSGLVLFIGLLIVAGIVAFIVKHWDTVSLCYC